MDSKKLGHGDESGFLFAQEMLAGDPTAAINFDRIQKGKSGFIIFEYLLCEETQTVTPFTSHPNRYFHKNKQKFISLWEIAQKLEAKLYLVNYAKLGTLHQDEIRFMEVIKVTDSGVQTKNYKYNRAGFSNFFRQLNRACLNQSTEPDPANFGKME